VTALDGERPPDCILIDIKLDGGEMNGIDLCRRLSQTHPSLASLIVTGHGAVGSAVEAMKHGAIDFLEKPLEDGTLLRGVHEAIATTSRQSHRAEEARRARERIATLTRRERQVLDMVVQGRLNKQMAAELGVSHKTIEVHRSHMMKKMQVGSVAELVRLVMLAREQLGDGEGV
jgi:two-component system response regulator FixJ